VEGKNKILELVADKKQVKEKWVEALKYLQSKKVNIPRSSTTVPTSSKRASSLSPNSAKDGVRRSSGDHPTGSHGTPRLSAPPIQGGSLLPPGSKTERSKSLGLPPGSNLLSSAPGSPTTKDST